MPGDGILSSAPIPLPGGASVGRRAGLEIRRLTYRAGADFARHDHGYASLFVMLVGHVREQSGRALAECPAGAVGFIPAGVEHRSRFGEAQAHGLTVVLPEGWLRRFAGADPGRLTEPGYAQNPMVCAAAFRLYCACRRPDATRALATEELILDLLGWVAGSGGPDRRVRGPAPAWVRDVTDLVRANAGGPIGLGDVADAVDRHPAHVCRAFKAAFGCSISEYVRFVRVERACELLRCGGSSLASIALDAGFYDQPHFSRVFRRHIGVTPREYRACFG